ncbi:MAG TPA: NAD-dependent deacylase [Candidatus Hydrogenedentes bacterium]|nr:NAD-dependent deacylase [Candidatus Hydrogenedentota bacterium]
MKTHKDDDNLYERAAETVKNTTNAIAVTGAGISVESGIPDFRSAGGLWARYPPDEYATMDAFFRDPDKVWEMWYELAEELKGVQPNPGHYALAELERLGHIKAVITQNIDALHQHAGSNTVIEYHGNADQIACTACFRHRAMDLSQRALGAPRCECGGVMKPDVVLFGEVIPEYAMKTSDMLARGCDVLIVVGTSAQVYPAASLPYLAKEHGAKIIECNTQPTNFTGVITDIFLEGPAGQTLPKLVALVKEKKE